MKVWYGDARATRRSALVVTFRVRVFFDNTVKVLESWKFDSENQSVCQSRKARVRVQGEALAGVADRVREQQSPELACASERGRAWFCEAKRPDEVGVATERSPRSGDMRSMRAAQRRSRAGAQAPLARE